MDISQLQSYYKCYDAYCSFLQQLVEQPDGPSSSIEFFKGDKRREELQQAMIDNYLVKYETVENPVLTLAIGHIGSGKTSLCEQLKSDSVGNQFLNINFDEVKLALPEYRLLKQLSPYKAAAFVQSESAKIAGRLFKQAVKKKVNILYEKNIAQMPDGRIHLAYEILDAVKKGYRVRMNVIFLDSYKMALQRVRKRFEKNRRYVNDETVEGSFNKLFENFNTLMTSEKLLPILHKRLDSGHRAWECKFWYNGGYKSEELGHFFCDPEYAKELQKALDQGQSLGALKTHTMFNEVLQELRQAHRMGFHGLLLSHPNTGEDMPAHDESEVKKWADFVAQDVDSREFGTVGSHSRVVGCIDRRIWAQIPDFVQKKLQKLTFFDKIG